MKSKLIYVLLLTLFITNGVMLFMLLNKPHERPRGKNEDFLIKELKFNMQQSESFAVLNDVHRREMKQFDKNIIKLKKELFNSFSKEVYDSSLTLKIGELEGKKEREVFTFFTKVKNICNAEQIERFNSIIERAISNIRPGPGGPRNNDMRPPPNGMGPKPPRN